MAVQSPISGSFKCHEPLSGAENSLSPVIMLHGITGSGRFWKDIPQVIAEETKRKVYVLDARNHGDSEWSDVFNLDILIEDLDHFMNKMGIPKAILIGHSMGGKTSMGLTLSKPEKVDKLVVEDMTPGLIRDENRDNVLHLIALLKSSLSIIPPGSDEKTARKMVWDFVLSKLPPDQVSEKRRNDGGSVLPMKRTSEGYSWQTNLDLLEKSLHGYHGFNEQFSGVYNGDTLFIYGAKSTYEIFQPVTVAYTCSEPSGGADPDLSPVILLHGLTSSRISWLNIPQIIAEKTRRKVYNLEARNHGDSGSSEVFNYQVLALDVEHFMEIKNISRAIIIGHSLGGKTAMTLALSKPDKIEKMVIEDISPKPAPSYARFSTVEYINYMKESLLLIPPGSDETTARKVLADFLISKMSPEEISQGFVRHCASTLLIKLTDQGYVWHMNLDGICKEFLAGKSKSPDLKGKFQKDVLFVYGKESSFKIFQDEEFILQLFPKAQFIGIEGATHRVHLDCPEIFAEKVVEFLGVKNPS